METAIGEEIAVENDYQRKFPRIVMVRVQVTIAWNDSGASFSARKIYFVLDCASGLKNRVQHNSRA